MRFGTTHRAEHTATKAAQKHSKPKSAAKLNSSAPFASH
jgi:hypothetical protein